MLRDFLIESLSFFPEAESGEAALEWCSSVAVEVGVFVEPEETKPSVDSLLALMLVSFLESILVFPLPTSSFKAASCFALSVPLPPPSFLFDPSLLRLLPLPPPSLPSVFVLPESPLVFPLPSFLPFLCECLSWWFSCAWWWEETEEDTETEVEATNGWSSPL